MSLLSLRRHLKSPSFDNRRWRTKALFGSRAQSLAFIFFYGVLKIYLVVNCFIRSQSRFPTRLSTERTTGAFFSLVSRNSVGFHCFFSTPPFSAFAVHVGGIVLFVRDGAIALWLVDGRRESVRFECCGRKT